MPTIKLFEENIGRTHFDINHSNIFLDPLLKVMKRKTKTNKKDLNFKASALYRKP